MSKYEGRVDPIQLLRGAFADGKLIKYKERHLLFEKGVKLPLNTLTAWVGMQSHKNYSLGSLWLYLEHALKHSSQDYLQRVTHYGLEAVTVSDRRDIEDYFLGRVKTSPCIDQQLWLQLASRGQNKHSSEEMEEVRRKAEMLSSELVVIDFISKFQRPISSKSRSLRCPNKSLETLLKVCHTNTATEKEKNTRFKQMVNSKKVPIIIVPEHQLSGNISLANIQRLLAFGEYVPNPLPLPEHQQKCEIMLTVFGRKTLFEVNCNPKLMSASNWPYVVAVFLQGHTKNEFEGWTCSDPAAIFKQAKVFRLRFQGKEELPLESGVKELILERNHRYRDALVQRQILLGLEQVLGETV